jgi:hypothetical protein
MIKVQQKASGISNLGELLFSSLDDPFCLPQASHSCACHASLSRIDKCVLFIKNSSFDIGPDTYSGQASPLLISLRHAREGTKEVITLLSSAARSNYQKRRENMWEISFTNNSFESTLTYSYHLSRRIKTGEKNDRASFSPGAGENGSSVRRIQRMCTL